MTTVDPDPRAPATAPSLPSGAPISVRRVILAVRDLDRTAAFYESVIGLEPIERAGHLVRLGAGGRDLLELRGDRALAPADPRSAGLFHTAFLLPDRASLGRFLAHAIAHGVVLEGASDHKVSEALYLSDPEGNGIEVYADRPQAAWSWSGGTVAMSTDPIDGEGVLAAGAGEAWTAAPAGTVVGHVHLRVGDTDVAERFWRDGIGLDLTCRYPGGSFFGSGGYHHQVAANVWRSRGAGERPAGTTGLVALELDVRPDVLSRTGERLAAAGHLARDVAGGVSVPDPWNTEVRLLAA